MVSPGPHSRTDTDTPLGWCPVLSAWLPACPSGHVREMSCPVRLSGWSDGATGPIQARPPGGESIAPDSSFSALARAVGSGFAHGSHTASPPAAGAERRGANLRSGAHGLLLASRPPLAAAGCSAVAAPHRFSPATAAWGCRGARLSPSASISRGISFRFAWRIDCPSLCHATPVKSIASFEARRLGAFPATLLRAVVDAGSPCGKLGERPGGRSGQNEVPCLLAGFFVSTGRPFFIGAPVFLRCR